jgi:hypothetical protein
MKSLSTPFGLLIVLALAGSTWLARPIQDPDFFWHLKMGEWLWQHHSWPIPDPFAFTTPATLDLRQLFIVKGYWLSQLAYFAGYSALGWTGIYLLRLAVFSVFVWILWKYRQGDGWLWGGAALACLAAIFDPYPVERPQFFSFLLFAWLYLLLDSLWRGQEDVSRRHFWSIGVVMLLWGNLHGGVILGQVLLLLTLALSVFGSRWLRRRVHPDGSALWRLAVVGLLAGCCNPNVFRIVPILLQTTDTSALMFASNDEYASLLKTWQGPMRSLVFPYLIFAGCAVVAALGSLRRQPLFSLLVLIGTGSYAAMHVRYIPFFLIASLPIIVRGLEGLPLRWGVRGLVVAGSLVLTMVLAWNDRGNIATVRSAGWVSDRDFPVGIAEQVVNSSINGHLFNLYRWGGYLLWRLGPERQVCVDGRALDGTVNRDVLTAEMVSFGGGRLLWKEIFDKYRIDYAILPLVEQGQPYALTQAIARDPSWQVASSAGNAVLLVRQ